MYNKLELIEIINANGGINGFRCFAKMDRISGVLPWGWAVITSGHDTWTECYIDESKYKVSDKYKITLRALDQNFSYEHYYQSDFLSSIKNGHVLVKTNINQHVVHKKAIEHLCGEAYLVHEYDIVAN